MDLFQVIMGFEFTKSELEEFYCIFGKPQPQVNILHYSHYTQLVRSEKKTTTTTIRGCLQNEDQRLKTKGRRLKTEKRRP